MELLIATTNSRKFKEIASILSFLKDLKLLSLSHFPKYQVPKETGKTFEENAHLKAIQAASLTKKWVIAEDSGLVIPALNNEPGIRSARYAGENASDEENLLKIIHRLEKIDASKRLGHYICCMILMSPSGEKTQITETCQGSLILEKRGIKGFGYDPIFMPEGHSKTFGELDADVKHRLSHRGKALTKIKNIFSKGFV